MKRRVKSFAERPTWRARLVGALALACAALGGCERDPTLLQAFPRSDIVFDGSVPDSTGIAQRELGRLLFFEKELSGNRDISCATCHVLFTQASEARRLSIGTGGIGVAVERVAGPNGSVTIARNSPDLFLRSDPSMTSLFWDGRLETTPTGIRSPIPIPPGITALPEIQVLLPLLDRDEMRGDLADLGNTLAQIPDDQQDRIFSEIMNRLMAVPGYSQLFAAAFPEAPEFGHDITHVARAIVVFENALWSRFDAPVDLGPMSSEAVDGLQVFNGVGQCSRCHGGTLFTDMSFHNIGVPQIGPGKDSATGLDEGRFRVTGNPADRFAFRTPPLRNVEFTAPYMHNGAYLTLEGAIRHHLDPETRLRSYADPNLPAGPDGIIHDDPATLDAIVATLDPFVQPTRPLTDSEIDALVAFLKALSSTIEMTVQPEDGVPNAVPSGLPIDTWPGGLAPSRFNFFQP